MRRGKRDRINPHTDSRGSERYEKLQGANELLFRFYPEKQVSSVRSIPPVKFDDT